MTELLGRIQEIIHISETTLRDFLFLFVCLGFSSHSNFHSYGDVTIAGEGLQILTTF